MLQASADPSAEQFAAPPSGIAAPRPTLRGREVLALTVGIVIGAGIFRSPSLVAGAAGSEAASSQITRPSVISSRSSAQGSLARSCP